MTVWFCPCCIYDRNWDKPGQDEKMQLIKTCELPDGYREYYEQRHGEDIKIVGRIHQINVLQAYESSWGKEAIHMIEADTFPLKKEYMAVTLKIRGIKNDIREKT